MCLGIPARIVRIEGVEAEVDVEGIRRTANISLTPVAAVGDYALLHAGFAIEILDIKEARERLELLRQLVVRENDST